MKMDEYGRRTKIALGPIRQEWIDRALCLGAGADLWFPSKSQNIPVAAKAICAQCPVREQCLQYALENREEYGVWGGLSPSERRKLPRGRRIRARAECGTTGGYRAHYRLGEPYCDACRAANSEQKRKWRQARAAA